MRSRKPIFAGLAFGLAVLALGAETKVTPAQIRHVEEIATNIVEVADPAAFPRLAYELGRYPCRQSLDALQLMLAKCEEKGDINQSAVWRDNIYLAKAYVIYAMARIGFQYQPGEKMLKESFEISRPVGMALMHSKRSKLAELLQKEVGFLMDKPARVSSDVELYQMKTHIKGSAFIMQNCPEVQGTGIRYEDYQRVLEAIALLESTKSAKSLPLLHQMLGHPESRFWEKPVYRAVFNLDIPDGEKLAFYKTAYADTRNKTLDQPPANPKAEPEFEIRSISAEAHLILLISRLDVPFADKIPFYEKSLASKSYTARIAVVDSMVRDRLFDKLGPIMSPKNRDASLKRFTVFRLGYDSAAGSKAFLKKLTKAADPEVQANAKEALAIK